jgi:hypothetical protein
MRWNPSLAPVYEIEGRIAAMLRQPKRREEQGFSRTRNLSRDPALVGTEQAAQGTTYKSFRRFAAVLFSS